MITSNLPGESARQEELSPEKVRDAFRICLITAILMSVITLIGGLAAYLAEENYYGVMAAGFVAIMAWISAWLCRRGQASQGVLVLLSGIYLGALPFPFISDYQSIAIAILVVLLTWYIAYSTLPPRSQGVAILTGVVAGVLVILLDIYGPDTGLPGMPELTLPLVIGTALLYGLLIARQFRSYPLRTKLIFAFLSVTLIPLAILAFQNNVSTLRFLEQETNLKLAESARQSANVIDSFIKMQLDALRTEAQIPAFRDFLSGRATETQPDVDEGNKIQETLVALSRKDPIYIVSYALLDQKGLNVVDTVPENIGKNESYESYFLEAISTGLPYLSPVLFVGEANAPRLFFSSPIRNTVGEIVGVLRLSYNAAVLQSLLINNLRQDVEGMYGVLVDDQYYIRLGHTRSPDLMYKTYGTLDPTVLSQLKVWDRLPFGTLQELATDQPEFVAALENLAEQPYFVTGGVALGGEAAVTTATHLKYAPWLVVARQSQAIALQPVREQTRAAVALVLLIAVVVAAVALAAAQVLSAPIVRLTGVAEQVKGGDLNARATVESQDEIGALAATFNTMTVELQNTLQGLEQRVAERTQAIELSADVSRRLSTILDFNQLVTEVVELVQQSFNYYHVHIYLFDEGMENLVMVGGTGEAGKTMLENGHKLPRGKGLVGQACEMGSAVLVQDTTHDPHWLPNPLLPETKSEIAMPIMLGEQVLGALDVQQNTVGGLGQQDSDLLRSIANQLAVALNNARQYAETQRHAERQVLIDSIIKQIQEQQTVESALKVAVRELGRAVKAPRTRARINLDDNGKN